MQAASELRALLVRIAGAGFPALSKRHASWGSLMLLLRLVLSLSCLVFTVQGAASAQPESSEIAPQQLIPHRAIYDLSLAEGRGAAGVRAVQGRAVYEFARNACDSVSLSYRQAMTMDSGEGANSTLDFRSVTEENDAGTAFSFDSTNVVGGKTENQTKGRAQRTSLGSDALVTLLEPQRTGAQLEPGVLFPTQHLRRVLAAAKSGKAMLQAELFEGSEPGDVVQASLTVIGKVRTAASELEPALLNAGMGNLQRWPMTISYFDKDDDSGEQTPKFTFGAEVFQNGISRALRLDYGTFALTGRLVGLEILPRPTCPPR